MKRLVQAVLFLDSPAGANGGFEHWSIGGDEMIQTILIPLEGSTFSERALPVGLELARTLHARLVLVCVAEAGRAAEWNFTDEDRQAISEQYAHVHEEEHVLSTDTRMVERIQGQVRAVDEAERYLQSIAARITEPGIQVEIAVPYGAPAEEILKEIEIRFADLVVMSTHGRSGVSRLIGGSVTIGVLAHSPVPVLLVPPERNS